MENNKPYGISLLSFKSKGLTLEMINKFNRIIFDFFNKKEIKPTYWGVDGKGFSEKLTKFTIRKLQNLEKKLFRDRDNKLIQGISYVVNHSNSDAPAYDGYLNVGIYFTEYNQTIQVYFMANPKYLNFDIPYELFIKLTEIMTVDYGFVYFHNDYDHVSAVILEYDDGKFEEDEYEKFFKWYRYSNEEKLKNIRDTYPIMFLNKKHYNNIIKRLLNGKKYKKILIEDYLVCLTGHRYFDKCKEVINV